MSIFKMMMAVIPAQNIVQPPAAHSHKPNAEPQAAPTKLTDIKMVFNRFLASGTKV